VPCWQDRGRGGGGGGTLRSRRYHQGQGRIMVVGGALICGSPPFPPSIDGEKERGISFKTAFILSGEKRGKREGGYLTGDWGGRNAS